MVTTQSTIARVHHTFVYLQKVFWVLLSVFGAKNLLLGLAKRLTAEIIVLAVLPTSKSHYYRSNIC